MVLSGDGHRQPAEPDTGGRTRSRLADVRERSTAHRLGLLAAISAVAGLLLAGVALPMVGGLGLAARAAIDNFERLPSVLKIPPLPLGSRIVAANGVPLAT